MKIAVTTMIWQRHSVFKVWASHYKVLQQKFPEIELIVTVAGSEGNVSKHLVESYGFKYIECPNTPLGFKANTRLMFTSLFAPDYVILVGSDDLISEKLFGRYIDWAKEGIGEVAPMDIYYYNAATEECAYSHGYQDEKRRGEPIAAGRMLSRHVLHNLSWQLWDNGEEKMLDGHPVRRLKTFPHSIRYYYCREEDAHLLDVKSPVNMTPFKWRKNFDEVGLEILKPFDVKKLKALKAQITKECVG